MVLRARIVIAFHIKAGEDAWARVAGGFQGTPNTGTVTEGVFDMTAMARMNSCTSEAGSVCMSGHTLLLLPKIQRQRPNLIHGGTRRAVRIFRGLQGAGAT